MSLDVLLVVQGAPYGSEGPYDAVRRAEVPARRAERVEKDPVEGVTAAPIHDLAEAQARCGRTLSF